MFFYQNKFILSNIKPNLIHFVKEITLHQLSTFAFKKFERIHEDRVKVNNI